jgi:uncharacterized membrane protein
MIAALTYGTPDWMIPACIALVVAVALVAWSYWQSAMKRPPRLLAGSLKVAAIAALAFCLLEPMFSGSRPRPGANLFVLLADNSRSLRVRDSGERETRGELLKSQLDSQTEWQTRLSQDFDVRRYSYDRRLRPVEEFDDLGFDGSGSALFSSLTSAIDRFRGRPNAGVLLFSDGHSTDVAEQLVDWEDLPPIYPVVLGSSRQLRDIRLSRITVTQTNFEAAPVTIAAEVAPDGLDDEKVILQLLDEAGAELQRTVVNSQPGKAFAHRFQVRPEKPGISFYQVRAFAEIDEEHLATPERTSEATLENNTRWAVVDRGGGPYRVLYVTGRPNWEFKFLRRALQEDDEVDLVGLIRIAKKEPKFTFRGRQGESSNTLFRGFDNQEDEETEQYDQPVLLRIGTEDAEELRDGFPKASEELFRYHAIVLDDVEAAYFTQDQMSVIQEFVSQRGGGFLMLGGRESYGGGKYARTPIGELLPVYVDAPATEPVEKYQLALTREGWLQPWVRVRSTEQAEDKRLEEMPAFRTVNRVRSIKPGASVLSRVKGIDGKEYPALVVQRFGKGRAAAALLGDLWRWGLRRISSDESDLEKSWRQTIRWLVADVPGRVEVETRRKKDDPAAPIELMIRIRDEEFRPLDNAEVTVTVKTPEGTEVKLPADPSDQTAGTYVAVFTSRIPGPYRAEIVATADDGSEIGRRAAGWAAEPSMDEFETLVPNRKLLQEIAEKTQGEVIELDEMHTFVSSLPNRKIPITQPWTYPLWHQWSVFALALSCLVGEWGIRRWNGLP